MSARFSGCRGFTLIELIASITIMAIIAAIALPRFVEPPPFEERGYVETLAASLRQARAVAIASGCAVQFTVNGAGYQALQRDPAATHCATAGAFSTAVRRGDGDVLAASMPTGATLTANRQFVFSRDGRVAGAPYTMTLGSHSVTVEPSGLVH